MSPSRDRTFADNNLPWFLEQQTDGSNSFNLFPDPGTPEQREHPLTVLKTIGSQETRKVNRVGADLGVRRMEKFPDRQSSS